MTMATMITITAMTAIHFCCMYTPPFVKASESPCYSAVEGCILPAGLAWRPMQRLSTSLRDGGCGASVVFRRRGTLPPIVLGPCTIGQATLHKSLRTEHRPGAPQRAHPQRRPPASRTAMAQSGPRAVSSRRPPCSRHHLPHVGSAGDTRPALHKTRSRQATAPSSVLGKQEQSQSQALEGVQELSAVNGSPPMRACPVQRCVSQLALAIAHRSAQPQLRELIGQPL